MKKFWTRYISWAISPIALGFYITLSLMYLTVSFYLFTEGKKAADEGLSLPSILYAIHQKTIDYRLRVRGPRVVTSNIAILAADERAVEALGRWPWPHEYIAEALKRVFAAGAKQVAFDIIWPEPSVNPADRVLTQLGGLQKAPPAVASVLQSLSAQMDSDKILGDALKKYSDRIVAGSFFDEARLGSYPPETEFCHDLVFKRTPAAKQWDKEEVFMSVADPYTPFMPASLLEDFKAVLNELETQVRKQLAAPRDRNEEYTQEERVESNLLEACDTILDDYKEGFSQVWQEDVLAKENPAEFKFKTYQAWLDDYRKKSFANSIKYVDAWKLNTPTIAAGTKHTANFNVEIDSDGTVRSTALVVRTGSSYFPSLALKSYLVANNFNASPKLSFEETSGKKDVVDFEITNNDNGETVTHLPTDRLGRLLVNYAGPMYMFPYISFADVLSDSPTARITQNVYDPKAKTWRKGVVTEVDKAKFLKDKILIAGATATGIFDLRVTPFQENFPGTETHANALENMMEGHFLRTDPNETTRMLMVLAVMGVTLTLLLSSLGAVYGLALTVATLIAIGLFDQYVLFNKGVVVSIIWPYFLTIALYTTLTFYRYLTEERNKRELRQTFQKYVSPAIVEEILAHPDNVELGGRKANLTVFFSDVRGFTTISEKLDPRALTDLLNSYLTPMTEIVFQNRGTLDKYMGDAVMAFFGAPIAYEDHAKWACRCALQSVEKLFELQREYEKKGLPTVDLGIGLNSGEVNVGNMGSQTVRSYTVMGDAVNLASRLEGINKQYGTRIVMSEFTYAQVKDSFVCRELDRVRVKGKVLPVRIFELIAEGPIPEDKRELLLHFQKGYELYHAKNWRDSLAEFNQALNAYPQDEVSKLYIQRCQNYLDEPPESNWDGVFVMKSK